MKADGRQQALLSRRRELLESVLESSRVEVVRRLKAKRLPLTMKVQRLVILDNPDGTGWGSDWREVRVSPLQSDRINFAIRDGSIPHVLLGLRDQLQPLAEYLDATTDLGTRPTNWRPNATGVEAILARYLVPLATYYLKRLRNLQYPRPLLLDSLVADLDTLCDPSVVLHSSQLPLEGLRVRRAMTHRDVTVRPLSSLERGAVLEAQENLWASPETGEFMVPRRIAHFSPSVLIQAQTTRPRVRAQDESRMAYRVALALFLSGFKIGASGVLIGFDRPWWAAMGFGMRHSPFPVSEGLIAQSRDLSPMDFRAVVDLAHRIPAFGSEGTRRDVVLFRVLRGCGSHGQESGFLDFAISLEAALLDGVRTELAYRFSLYGALYLRHERDPKATFDKLRSIYDVRSRLVHGSPVRAEDRVAAERDAADLAKAVARKAVQDGWPDPRDLDNVALWWRLQNRRNSARVVQ